ncbi:MAG: neurogenic locus notch [Legionella sp.]
MLSLKNFFFASLLSLLISPTFSANNSGYVDVCCSNMGGVSYCDSSAGRLVCKNGFYSACYCTPHAVMDLQLFRGCCLWKGGVVTTYNITGFVLCNDGSISEECSLTQGTQSIASW